MHAAYSFLIEIPEELSGLTPQSDPSDEDELRQYFESEFERRFAEPHCDENNWHMLKSAVLKNGHVLQLAAPGDWRGRDKFYNMILEKWGDAPARFDQALKFAAECVAHDMRLFEASSMRLSGEDMSYSEIVKAIHEHVPKDLMERYSQYSPPEKPSDWGSVNWLDHYRRKRLAASFELFVEGCKFSTAPFTPPGSGAVPYTYRAFDIREEEYGEISENCAILIVDIHT